MKKLAFFLAVLLLLLAPAHAGAESGMALIENSADFNGKTVTYQGEVIGVMMRGGNAWVNVYDNSFVIGIWCSAEDVENITFTGDYTHIGDTVEVIGTFHLACTEHGGDLDIHAENFTVLASGTVVERVPNLLAVLLSVILVAVAIFTVFWLRRLREERSKIVPWPMSWT